MRRKGTFFLLIIFLYFCIFTLGWYEDNWFEVNLKSENISCTAEEMREAAEGHLTTEALMWNQNNQKTISGMSSEDFRCIIIIILSILDQNYFYLTIFCSISFQLCKNTNQNCL